MFKRSPKGAQSRKKRHLKLDAKNDVEQIVKSVPKGHRNDVEMGAKIDEHQCDF